MASISASRPDAGLQRAAREIIAGTEVFDLHVETFLPRRLFGLDFARARSRWNRGYFFGHLDAPGIRAHGLKGAMWSLSANVLLRPAARWYGFLENLQQLERELHAAGMRTAADYTSYRRERKSGRHVGLIAIQGANVCEGAPAGALSLPGRIVRATLVHLTNSVYGATTSPFSLLRRDRGLSARGRLLVEQLNARRIFVDLAHVHPRSFRDALACHARDLPPLVTHTGVDGVRPHWRNLDDEQIRAVAERGGVVGVIFSDFFLRPRGRRSSGDIVLDHIEHIIRVAGEDVPALGSDFDGMITPPPELRDARAYERLAAGMLKRGWRKRRIRKILGENFLKVFRRMRP